MSDAEGKTNVGKPRVKWAVKYDSCVRCGRDDVKHLAQGLCVTCYERDANIRNKGYRLQGQGLRKELTEKYLLQEYVKNKRSTIDIAKELGCTRQTVAKALKDVGIASRSQAEASDLAFRRGKKKVRRIDESGHRCVTTLDKIDVNEHFFSIWSPAMAYVLGAVYTDGCIIPGYNIDPRRSGRSVSYLSLAQKEPELLQKVLALMDCNAKLQYSKERRCGSVVAGALYSFVISSETMYYDLLSLGVTPNKSLTLSFPQMPGRELIRHFVRGCWDGDGTVFVPTPGNTAQAYAGIVSGSTQFMTGLVEHLYHIGIKRFSGQVDEPIRILRNHNAYDIRIKGRKNLITLFHYLYDGVDSSMRLERKYMNFVEIMRLYDELPRPAKANDLIKVVLDELHAEQIEIKPVQDLLISLWYKGKRFMYMEPRSDFLIADVLTPEGNWSGRKRISSRKEWDVVYHEYIQKYIEYADEQ